MEGSSVIAQSVLARIAITILCGIGLYASMYMLRKSRQAERGELTGASIVNEPHARLFLGAPNSLWGSFYYPLLAAAVWAYSSGGAAPGLHRLILAAVAAAAATSLFLAYSLLLVTKRECPYCWTSHAVNWLLLWVVFFYRL